MKILHVITSLRTGGAEHLLVDLLPRLRDYGHEVSLLLFDGTRTPFYYQLEKTGITIYMLGKNVHSMHNPLLVFKLRKYLVQYDIVHTHNTPCQLLAAVANPAHRSILVTTEHSTMNRRRFWNWYKKIDRWMYSRYEHIICVSKDVENNLIRSLGDKHFVRTKIKTICNGVDIERIGCAQPDAYLQKQFSGCKLIGMVAAFRPEKDQKTLIKAMCHLQDNFHLLLIGDGICRNECERLSESLGMKERVHFLGIRTDVPSLLKMVDVVVLSSNYEGLSLSCIEGMASGKPFIASNVDGLREIVGGTGLLFPHGDSSELARLIKEVCENDSLYQRIARQCRQKAMQYDISHTVREYARVYEELAKE